MIWYLHGGVVIIDELDFVGLKNWLNFIREEEILHIAQVWFCHFITKYSLNVYAGIYSNTSDHLCFNYFLLYVVIIRNSQVKRQFRSRRG